jgi:hypothetical protein
MMDINTKGDTITCTNCNIEIKPKKNKLVATVKWANGVKQLYTNEHERPDKENVFIIPHPDKGFYYLNNNKILYVIDDVKNKVVVYDNSLKHNWFGQFDNNDIFYFPKYNVLICTIFGGDQDYIWWWKLNKYDQYANIEEPCYYNGTFNASLSIRKANDRYAVGTYYNYTNDCYKSDDEDYDNDENVDALTIIFDTKKMIYHEYTRDELKKELNVKKSMSCTMLQKKIINKMYTD